MNPGKVELSLILAGKQPEADLTEEVTDLADLERNQLRMFLRPTRFNTLEELVAMNRVYVEEREHEGKKRYLAVAEEDPNMVCEITKEAFETLLKTDIVEQTKSKIKKER